ncbi:MAG: hypothetical protein IH939_10935 [Acidobacteria bacterium]|nr:hypothetical protein [Acidobacteriota bacterium]
MLLLLCSAQPAAGHGVLHEQIAEISERLELEPTSALLYLTRGKLHRLHEAWEAALADYDRAAQLDPGLEAVDVARGLLWLEAGRFHFALAALDRVLARSPDHAGARLTRARVLVRLEAYEAASRDYSHALKFLSKPDHYIERTRALAALGEDHIGRAIRGLDEGRRRLGPIPTLQLYAIDLEVRLHRYDRALVRLGALRGHLGQPTWLARHAEILEQAGRLDQARTAYEAALDALRRLPLHRRQTHAMTQFGGRLHAALEQLTAALTSGTPLQHSTEVLGSP